MNISFNNNLKKHRDIFFSLLCYLITSVHLADALDCAAQNKGLNLGNFPCCPPTLAAFAFSHRDLVLT